MVYPTAGEWMLTKEQAREELASAEKAESQAQKAFEQAYQTRTAAATAVRDAKTAYEQLAARHAYAAAEIDMKSAIERSEYAVRRLQAARDTVRALGV